MNDLILKLKKLKLPKKSIALLVLCFVALGALSVGGLSEEEGEELSSVNTAAFSSDYKKKTEKELESLLGDIQGAGEVSVMITLESCYENVYAVKEAVVNEQDEDSYKSEIQEEYITVKKGSNNEECLVIKVYEPEIKGVAVVAQGADSSAVKTALTQTVCALFDISSAKVSVEKMQKN